MRSVVQSSSEFEQQAQNQHQHHHYYQRKRRRPTIPDLLPRSCNHSLRSKGSGQWKVFSILLCIQVQSIFMVVLSDASTLIRFSQQTKNNQQQQHYYEQQQLQQSSVDVGSITAKWYNYGILKRKNNTVYSTIHNNSDSRRRKNYFGKQKQQTPRHYPIQIHHNLSSHRQQQQQVVQQQHHQQRQQQKNQYRRRLENDNSDRMPSLSTVRPTSSSPVTGIRTPSPSQIVVDTPSPFVGITTPNPSQIIVDTPSTPPPTKTVIPTPLVMTEQPFPKQRDTNQHNNPNSDPVPAPVRFPSVSIADTDRPIVTMGDDATDPIPTVPSSSTASATTANYDSPTFSDLFKPTPTRPSAPRSSPVRTNPSSPLSSTDAFYDRPQVQPSSSGSSSLEPTSKIEPSASPALSPSSPSSLLLGSDTAYIDTTADGHNATNTTVVATPSSNENATTSENSQIETDNTGSISNNDSPTYKPSRRPTTKRPVSAAPSNPPTDTRKSPVPTYEPSNSNPTSTPIATPTKSPEVSPIAPSYDPTRSPIRTESPTSGATYQPVETPVSASIEAPTIQPSMKRITYPPSSIEPTTSTPTTNTPIDTQQPTIQPSMMELVAEGRTSSSLQPILKIEGMLKPSRQGDGTNNNSTDTSWLHTARNDSNTDSTNNTNSSSQPRGPKGERKVLRLTDFTIQVRSTDGQKVNNTAFEEIIGSYLVREMIFTNLVRVEINIISQSITKSALLEVYLTTFNCSGKALFVATPNINDEDQKSRSKLASLNENTVIPKGEQKNGRIKFTYQGGEDLNQLARTAGYSGTALEDPVDSNDKGKGGKDKEKLKDKDDEGMSNRKDGMSPTSDNGMQQQPQQDKGENDANMPNSKEPHNKNKNKNNRPNQKDKMKRGNSHRGLDAETNSATVPYGRQIQEEGTDNSTGTANYYPSIAELCREQSYRLLDTTRLQRFFNTYPISPVLSDTNNPQQGTNNLDILDVSMGYKDGQSCMVDDSPPVIKATDKTFWKHNTMYLSIGSAIAAFIMLTTGITYCARSKEKKRNQQEQDNNNHTDNKLLNSNDKYQHPGIMVRRTESTDSTSSAYMTFPLIRPIDQDIWQRTRFVMGPIKEGGGDEDNSGTKNIASLKSGLDPPNEGALVLSSSSSSSSSSWSFALRQSMPMVDPLSNPLIQAIGNDDRRDEDDDSNSEALAVQPTTSTTELACLIDPLGIGRRHNDYNTLQSWALQKYCVVPNQNTSEPDEDPLSSNHQLTLYSASESLSEMSRDDSSILSVYNMESSVSSPSESGSSASSNMSPTTTASSLTQITTIEHQGFGIPPSESDIENSLNPNELAIVKIGETSLYYL